ncbi:MAG: thermonuclease family protein [Desulfomonile tiedjei]|nr:thermonuclease family protein [Desulfomonile tiedjei]
MEAVRWAIILVLSLLYPEFYSPWTGKVVEIVRPDEIRVQKNDEKVENVRLYGIDCPLEPQRFANKARLYVADRVLGRTVVVQPLPGTVEGPWYRPKIEPYDRYHRVIAFVTIDGESLNRELLTKGLARWYQPFVPFERGLKRLEDSAREKNEGLWGYTDVTAPWRYQSTHIAKINPLQSDPAVEAAKGSELQPEARPQQKPPPQSEPAKPAVPEVPEVQVPEKPPAEVETPPASPASPSLQEDLPPAEDCREKEYVPRLKQAYQSISSLTAIYWYACSQIGLNWEKRNTLVGVYNPDPQKETQAEELLKDLSDPCRRLAGLHEDLLRLWTVCLQLKSLANQVPDDREEYGRQLKVILEESRTLSLKLTAKLGRDD